MTTIEVRTQGELDAALAAHKPGQVITCVGHGRFTIGGSATVWASGSASVEASGSASVRAWGSATVRAWDSASVEASGSATVEASGSATVWASGSATVRAWDSASVEASGSASVRAWGSATVEASGSATVEASGSATVWASGSATVRAWGSATVRAWDSATVWASGSATVRAWDSATVRAWDSASVEAWGSATVRAWDSASVRASRYVAVTVDRGRGSKAKVQGGVLIEIPPITTPEAWCDYHGVEVVDGVATLYKAVDDDWSTDRAREKDIFYRPGTALIEAPDWDKGQAECGGGIHLSPRPFLARRFNEGATRYVAVRVALADMRKPRASDDMPDKMKARRVSDIIEVDADGAPVAT